MVTYALGISIFSPVQMSHLYGRILKANLSEILPVKCKFTRGSTPTNLAKFKLEYN